MGKKILVICFYILFFATPLLFSSLNHELFEYNKMMLTYLLTVIITGTWLIRMIAVRKLLVRRTPLDLPILIFLGANILSTVFSIDQHTSIWGYYTRSNGGLLSIFSYTLLYFALVSNFEWKEAFGFLKAALWGGLLVSLYAIPEHFGVSPSCVILYNQMNASCWVQDVQARVFATLGQPNWLAAYLGMLIFPTVYLSLISQERFNKIVYGLIAVCMYLAFTFSYSRGSTLGLIAGLVTFVVLGYWKTGNILKMTKLSELVVFKPIGIFLASFLAVNLLFGSALTSFKLITQSAAPSRPTLSVAPAGTQLENGGTESGQIRLIVWEGALEVFKKYPIFGSGVETFAYSYYGSRPTAHNLVSEWDFLYNKAHNEYLNYLANTGIVGFTAYILLIGWFLVWAIKEIVNKEKAENRLLLAAITASYVSYLVQNIFGFSVVVIATYFYLFPALAIIAKSENIEKELQLGVISQLGQRLSLALANRRKFGKVIRIVSICLVVIVTINYVFVVARFWYADTLYAKGSNLVDSGSPLAGYNSLLWANILNSGEPLYALDLGYAAAEGALALSLEESESSESSEFIDDLKSLADLETKMILEQNPNNVSHLRTAIRTYYALSSIDSKYNRQVIESFDKAIVLAPTDAKLYYNKALVLGQLDQNDQAIINMNKALDLKPNYRDAYLSLATIYIQEKQMDKAKETLTKALDYFPGDKELLEKLSEI